MNAARANLLSPFATLDEVRFGRKRSKKLAKAQRKMAKHSKKCPRQVEGPSSSDSSSEDEGHHGHHRGRHGGRHHGPHHGHHAGGEHHMRNHHGHEHGHHGPMVRSRGANGFGSSFIKKNKFVVVVNVTGFETKDLTIKVENGFIAVAGKHNVTNDDGSSISRQFDQSYKVPNGIDVTTFKSQLKFGKILKITVDLKPEAQGVDVPIEIVPSAPTEEGAAGPDIEIV